MPQRRLQHRYQPTAMTASTRCIIVVHVSIEASDREIEVVDAVGVVSVDEGATEETSVEEDEADVADQVQVQVVRGADVATKVACGDHVFCVYC